MTKDEILEALKERSAEVSYAEILLRELQNKIDNAQSDDDMLYGLYTYNKKTEELGHMQLWI